MKFREPGKLGIFWKILWLGVAMLVLGGLITGSSSFLYNLASPNTTQSFCNATGCYAGLGSTNPTINLMFATVLCIIIAIAVVMLVYRHMIK